jgi:hypothetical protein
LAVEEQFYLFFPLLLVFTYRVKPNKVVLLLSILALLSLGLSELLVHTDNSLAFFASPSRFWQFIAGGLLAVNPRLVTLGKSLSKGVAEWLTLIGLAGIVFCLFTYTKQTQFPGLNALLPTMATGLVIFAAPSSHFSYQLLSCSVAKFFGKISYSLYLWHWPIIIFYQLSINAKPTFTEQAFIFTASILLGFISWYFIERLGNNFTFDIKNQISALKGRMVKPKINAIGMSLMGSALLAIIALVLLTGLPNRYSPEQLKYSAFINYDRKDYYRQGKCFLTSDFNDFALFDKNLCVSFDYNKHNTLLIGDSHAAQWYNALAVTKKTTETISQVTSSGCKPTMPYKGAKRCTQLMQWAIERLVIENDFDRIIIAARWQNNDLSDLIGTIKQLSAYSDDITVLGNIIEYDLPLPRLLASKETSAEVNEYRNYSKIQNRDKMFEKAIAKTSASYISVFNTICPEDEICMQTSYQGNPMQYDYGHLTFEGALQLVKIIKNKGML